MEIKVNGQHRLGRTRQRRILVVDDNVDAAEMLGLILGNRGYDVQLAYDGEDALDIATEFDPDLVILDIGLPGLDGYAVARRLRERFKRCDLALVALTGYGQAEDRRRSEEAGFDHHLVKPVTADELETILPAVD